MPAPAADSQLLVVCSSHSGNTARLVEALVEGTRSEGIEGVDVVVRAPLDAGPDDVVFIDEVPKTSVGKFSKKTLRDQFAEYQLPTV